MAVDADRAVSRHNRHLRKSAVHPEQPTRFRPNRQAPIVPHQNPHHRLLARLLDLPVHPAAQLLGHPQEVPLKRSRGQLEHRWLVPIEPGQFRLVLCDCK